MALYIILGILVILFVLVPLVLPGKVHFERSIEINAGADRIFPEVNTLKNWEKWSPWELRDNEIKRTYSGPESGVGSAYAWNSKLKNIGTGSLEIVSSVHNKSIGNLLQFGKNPSKAPCGFLFEQSGSRTKVIWYIDISFGKFLPGRYFGLFVGKLLQPDFDKGLANLKKLCEQ